MYIAFMEHLSDLSDCFIALFGEIPVFLRLFSQRRTQYSTTVAFKLKNWSKQTLWRKFCSNRSRMSEILTFEILERNDFWRPF